MRENFQQSYTKAAKEYCSRFPLSPRMEMLSKHNSPKLLDIYTPPLIQDDRGNSWDFSRLDSVPYICLSSEPGGGKSSFLLSFALHLLDQGKMPVLLSCRPKAKNLEAWVQESIDRITSCNIQGEKLMEKSLFVMLDDADTLLAEEEAMVHEAFKSYPWNWVITISHGMSVPSFLKDYPSRHLYIKPLNIDQIQGFCERWYRWLYKNEPEKKDKAMAGFFQGMKCNPSFLEICSIRVCLNSAVSFHTIEGVLPQDRFVWYGKLAEEMLPSEKKKEYWNFLPIKSCFRLKRA